MWIPHVAQNARCVASVLQCFACTPWNPRCENECDVSTLHCVRMQVCRHVPKNCLHVSDKLSTLQLLWCLCEVVRCCSCKRNLHCAFEDAAHVGVWLVGMNQANQICCHHLLNKCRLCFAHDESAANGAFSCLLDKLR